jgi:hypothetical protein
MIRTIVDTSVWRGFFAGRSNARRLGDLLGEPEVVLVHPLVVGELVLGGLSLAEQRLLERLPHAEQLDYTSVLAMIRRHKLSRRGVGWVDAELVASALHSRARLWSLDQSLASVTNDLAIGFDPAMLTQ